MEQESVEGVDDAGGSSHAEAVAAAANHHRGILIPRGVVEMGRMGRGG